MHTHKQNKDFKWNYMKFKELHKPHIKNKLDLYVLKKKYCM